MTQGSNQEPATRGRGDGGKTIKIRDLRKEFHSLRGRTTALDGISLEVAAGTFYVLLGPSGCGKSTLLSIIAGIEKPSRGEVVIGDRPVVSIQRKIFLPPRDRNVAMVFQSYALYPHMTVYDNIAFPLQMAKKDKTEIRTSVESVAATLEISDLLAVKPAELSGGQRQRVAIGRAIVRRPAALLLDEPLSNLDAQLRVTMRRELKALQRRLGVTTLYVTHDQMEAMTLGDEIAVMRDGSVEQVGTPDDVYERPGSVFVAKFVGTPPMNLLEGDVLTAAANRLPVLGSMDIARAVFGIRPERLKVARAGVTGVAKDAESGPVPGVAEEARSLQSGEAAGQSRGVLDAQVAMISPLGAEKLLYLNVGGQEVLARCPASESFGEGERVAVRFDVKDLVLFNKADGKRLDV